jgi:hypothetical protein
VRAVVVLCVVVAVAGAASVSAAAPAPPKRGIVVEGKTFGGLPLGLTKAQVKARWGRQFGVCDDCTAPTWYFTYKPFAPQGIGVEFDKHGRTQAYFTLGEPPWSTQKGLRTGDPSTRVTELYGNVPTVTCTGYSLLQVVKGKTLLLAYLDGATVYGLALQRPGVAPCR